MKLRIAHYATKNISTRNGPATTCRFLSGSLWYSSFLGTWNRGWRDGMEIEVDSHQIKIIEKDGRTYRNIGEPKKEKPQQSQPAPAFGGDFGFEQSVLSALDAIRKDLEEIKNTLRVQV